ncbi:MAG TPA: LacI family transcriptional regulator [Firmicutes bacterium]|nr:LacI family transcriptional regulator [Bacillota bacterium]
MASIFDVAQQAGCSIKTVSRVLNGSSEVKESTRQRVLQAIEKLNYEPSLFARGMVGRRTYMIGFYRCGPLTFGDTSRFFNIILTGLEKRLSGTGYRVLLESPYLHNSNSGLIPLAKQVDSILVIDYPTHALRVELASIMDKVPIVTIGRRHIGGQETYAVGPDNYANVELAVRHLAQLGHRRIGLVLKSRHGEHNRDRLAGYRRTMQQLGLPVDPSWIVFGHSKASVNDQLRGWMTAGNRPTGVFISGERIALNLLALCREYGLRVPHDLAIITHEDTYAAQLSTPALTVIRRQDEIIGEQAAIMLLNRIGGMPIPTRSELIKGELVIRESCGACCVDHK